MQNYHLYEDIGQGTGSVVYKARMKQTIEFVAVKKVTKDYKQRVLNEVGVLHDLKHRNVIKFLACYETRNHVWIVEEYSAGGDLMKVLKEDKKLPEWSIRNFARDIVRGLHYVHSEGFVYCDLKPSNLLLNEDGTVKLGDFGLSRSVYPDDATTPASTNAGTRGRGTPYYMAPELFHRQGVHSYASDLWALGCLLYEMATGQTPFQSRVLEKLIPKILAEQVQPVKGFSAEFNDLVLGLLHKDPRQRASWAQIAQDKWLQGSDGEFSLPGGAQQEMPEQEEFDVMLARLEEEGAIQQQKALHVASDEVTRMSMNAKRNLEITAVQQDGDDNEDNDEALGASYSRKGLANVLGLAAGPGGADRKSASPAAESTSEATEATSGDADPDEDAMRLPENRDLELDFNEGAAVGGESSSSPDAGDAAVDEKATTVATSPATAELQDPPADGEVSPGAGGLSVPETPTDAPPLSPSGDAKDVAAVEAKEAAADDMSEWMGLLRHWTDGKIRALADNATIRKRAKRNFSSKALGMSTLTAKQIARLGKEKQLAFYTDLYRIIDGKGAASQKSHCLTYLASIAHDAAVADMVVNSAIMASLVKLIKSGAKAGALLRAQALELVGTLMRNMSSMDQEVLGTGLLNALADQLRDSDRNVRRPAAAALGELLYYIWTRPEVAERPERDSLDGWHVKPHVVSNMVRCLRVSEDETVAHYAAQCMVNVCAGSKAKYFITQDVMSGAYQIYSHTRNQHLRSACAVLLFHVTSASKRMMSSLTDKIGIDPVAGGMEDKSSNRKQQAKVQLAFLNIFNFVLYHRVPRLSSLLRSRKTVLRALMRLLDKTCGSKTTGATAAIVSAKILLCLCQLGDVELGFVRECFKYKLGHNVGRLVHRLTRMRSGAPGTKDSKVQRESIEWLSKALERFRGCCQSWSVGLATDVMESIQTQTRRKNLPTPAKRRLKELIAQFPLLLDIVSAPALRERVVDGNFVETISSLLVAAQSAGSFPGDDAFCEALLSVVRAASQSVKILLELNQHVLSRLLPALVGLLGSKSSNNRFLALEILGDVLIQLFREVNERGRAGDNKKMIDMALDVIRQLLPQYKRLLADQDTIAHYALYLLNTLVEIDRSLVEDVTRFAITGQLMEFFEAKHPNNNLHTVKLVRSVAKAAKPPELEGLRILCSLDLVQGSVVLLKHVHKTRDEWFFEPLLDIIATLLSALNAPKDQVSATAAKAISEYCEGLTGLTSLLLELQLVGASTAKRSQRPSIIQIGLRGGTAGLHKSVLDPTTAATVRRLATRALHRLIENYPSTHPAVFSQANLHRLANGLAFATRGLQQAGKMAPAAQPPATVTDGHLFVQESLCRVLYAAIGSGAAKAQATVASFHEKNRTLMQSLQDISSSKGHKPRSVAHRIATEIISVISKKIGRARAGSGTRGRRF